MSTDKELTSDEYENQRSKLVKKKFGFYGATLDFFGSIAWLPGVVALLGGIFTPSKHFMIFPGLFLIFIGWINEKRKSSIDKQLDDLEKNKNFIKIDTKSEKENYTTTKDNVNLNEHTNNTKEVGSTFFNKLSKSLGAKVVNDNINIPTNIEPPQEKYRFGKKIDWDNLNEKRKITGIEGEELVMILEEEYLKSINRSDLASQIRHISKEEGDGLGYDILSYFDDGRKKYIEVKSTKSSIETPFTISQNELSFLEDHYDDAFIYRVLLDGEESKVNVRPAYEVLESNITPIVFRVK